MVAALVSPASPDPDGFKRLVSSAWRRRELRLRRQQLQRWLNRDPKKPKRDDDLPPHPRFQI